MISNSLEYKKLILNFLERQLILHLATSVDTQPWNCALEFSHTEDLSLYWRSDASSRHSTYLLRNPECSVAVTSIDSENKGEGIQSSGTARLVTDPDIIARIAQQIDAKRVKKMSTEVVEKESAREYWCYQPREIQYLNERLLGYGRVEISLG